MTDNIKYNSYNSYDDIEVWYGDRDKGKFIIGTRSEKEADKVINELNTLLSENIRFKKENKEIKENVSRLINDAILEILDGQRYEGERVLNEALRLLE